MDYNVGQIAKRAGVTSSTVRTWAREFGDFLSESANPPPGQERRFTEADAETLLTVAALRAEDTPLPRIHTELAGGVRKEAPARPVIVDEPARSTAAEAEEDAPRPSDFTAALAIYDSQLARLQAQLAEVQRERLDAEKRATAAEERMKVMAEMHAEASAGAAKPLGFWDWVRTRR